MTVALLTETVKNDIKLMGNATKPYPPVEASNKEEWPLGMDQILMGS